MYKSYKFRLYPSDSQKELIHKTFGCTRFIYNYFLDECMKNGFIKAFDMCKKIKELYLEYPFLKEVVILNLKVSIINKVIELIV